MKPRPLPELADAKTRKDLLIRLRRAEGQLRGIQRMIEEGQPCLDVANQVAAVRKALDSSYVRMTVCFMQERLQSTIDAKAPSNERLDSVLADVQELLGKVR